MNATRSIARPPGAGGMHGPRTRATSRERLRRHRGFTLVEVLIVIGIIIVLVTILIVALASATTRAGAARTTTLLQSLEQSTSRFREDHGVLPQILDDGRNVRMYGPNPQRPYPLAGDFAGLQDWWSITSSAEYLIGYGGPGQDGADGLGIRGPGREGAWGATRVAGLLADRNPITTGKVYPPYVQLEDEELLGSVDAGGNIFLPGEGGYDPLDPKVILDYWGRPIRFYLDHPDRSMDLGDVIVLRPFEMASGSESTSPFADARADNYTSAALKSGKFAYFSAGPDGELNPEIRYDDPDDPQNTLNTDFANQDNLVEVGQ